MLTLNYSIAPERFVTAERLQQWQIRSCQYLLCSTNCIDTELHDKNIICLARTSQSVFGQFMRKVLCEVSLDMYVMPSSGNKSSVMLTSVIDWGCSFIRKLQSLDTGLDFYVYKFFQRLERLLGPKLFCFRKKSL